ncbi:MAG: glycogen/starch synthase, partial [Endomicrobiales bacterium]
ESETGRKLGEFRLESIASGEKTGRYLFTLNYGGARMVFDENGEPAEGDTGAAPLMSADEGETLAGTWLGDHYGDFAYLVREVTGTAVRSAFSLVSFLNFREERALSRKEGEELLLGKLGASRKGYVFEADVDKLREMNKYLGKRNVDFLIRQYLNVLQREAGKFGGFAIRWGGDEALGYLPKGRSIQRANTIFNRMREKVNNSFRKKFGVAVLPDNITEKQYQDLKNCPEVVSFDQERRFVLFKVRGRALQGTLDTVRRATGIEDLQLHAFNEGWLLYPTLSMGVVRVGKLREAKERSLEPRQLLDIIIQYLGRAVHRAKANGRNTTVIGVIEGSGHEKGETTLRQDLQPEVEAALRTLPLRDIPRENTAREAVDRWLKAGEGVTIIRILPSYKGEHLKDIVSSKGNGWLRFKAINDSDKYGYKGGDDTIRLNFAGACIDFEEALKKLVGEAHASRGATDDVVIAFKGEVDSRELGAMADAMAARINANSRIRVGIDIVAVTADKEDSSSGSLFRKMDQMVRVLQPPEAGVIPLLRPIQFPNDIAYFVYQPLLKAELEETIRKINEFEGIQAEKSLGEMRGEQDRKALAAVKLILLKLSVGIAIVLAGIFAFAQPVYGAAEAGLALQPASDSALTHFTALPVALISLTGVSLSAGLRPFQGIRKAFSSFTKNIKNAKLSAKYQLPRMSLRTRILVAAAIALLALLLFPQTAYAAQELSRGELPLGGMAMFLFGGVLATPSGDKGEKGRDSALPDFSAEQGAMRKAIMNEDYEGWRYFSGTFSGYLDRIKKGEENAAKELTSFLDACSALYDVEMRLYPVEGLYPVLQAAALLSEEYQELLLKSLNKETAGAGHLSSLIDALLLQLDSEAPDGWLERYAPELEGREIFSVSPEISLLAGGLGYVTQMHGRGMKTLGAKVSFVEPRYRKRFDRQGNLMDIDYDEYLTDISRVDSFEIYIDNKAVKVNVLRGIGKGDGIPVYLLEEDGENAYYTNMLYNYQSTNNPVSWEEYVAFFNKAAFEFIKRKSEAARQKMGEEWKGPVVYGNDGQAGPLMALVRQEQEKGNPAFRDALAAYTTHTYKNRGFFGRGYLGRLMWLFGVEKKYHTAFARGDDADITSGGVRLSDVVNGVSVKHVKDVQAFDKEAQLVAVTNGDDIDTSTRSFREIYEGLYGKPCNVKTVSAEEVRAVKREARTMLARNMGLKIDPDKPLASFAGRLVDEKAGMKRAYTGNNIRELVLSGYQVVIFGRLQDNPESRELKARLEKLEAELAGIYEGLDEKGKKAFGYLKYVSQFNDGEKKLLLVGTDLLVLDSDDHTGACEYTEVNGSAGGAIILSPPWQGGEGIIRTQGIRMNPETPGEGNTVVPENGSPEAYLKTMKETLRMAQEEPLKFASYCRSSLQLTTILTARHTGAAYLRAWAKSLRIKNGYAARSAGAARAFGEALKQGYPPAELKEIVETLLNKGRNGVASFKFTILGQPDGPAQSAGIEGFLATKNAIENEVCWDALIGHLERGDYLRYFQGLFAGARGSEGILSFLEALQNDPEVSWYGKDRIFSAFAGALAGELKALGAYAQEYGRSYPVTLRRAGEIELPAEVARRLGGKVVLRVNRDGSLNAYSMEEFEKIFDRIRSGKGTAREKRSLIRAVASSSFDFQVTEGRLSLGRERGDLNRVMKRNIGEDLDFERNARFTFRNRGDHYELWPEEVQLTREGVDVIIDNLRSRINEPGAPEKILQLRKDQREIVAQNGRNLLYAFLFARSLDSLIRSIGDEPANAALKEYAAELLAGTMQESLDAHWTEPGQLKLLKDLYTGMLKNTDNEHLRALLLDEVVAGVYTAARERPGKSLEQARSGRDEPPYLALIRVMKVAAEPAFFRALTEQLLSMRDSFPGGEGSVAYDFLTYLLAKEVTTLLGGIIEPVRLSLKQAIEGAQNANPLSLTAGKQLGYVAETVLPAQDPVALAAAGLPFISVARSREALDVDELAALGRKGVQGALGVVLAAQGENFDENDLAARLVIPSGPDRYDTLAVKAYLHTVDLDGTTVRVVKLAYEGSESDALYVLGRGATDLLKQAFENSVLRETLGFDLASGRERAVISTSDALLSLYANPRAFKDGLGTELSAGAVVLAFRGAPRVVPGELSLLAVQLDAEYLAGAVDADNRLIDEAKLAARNADLSFGRALPAEKILQECELVMIRKDAESSVMKAGSNISLRFDVTQLRSRPDREEDDQGVGKLTCLRSFFDVLKGIRGGNVYTQLGSVTDEKDPAVVNPLIVDRYGYAEVRKNAVLRALVSGEKLSAGGTGEMLSRNRAADRKLAEALAGDRNWRKALEERASPYSGILDVSRHAVEEVRREHGGLPGMEDSEVQARFRDETAAVELAVINGFEQFDDAVRYIHANGGKVNLDYRVKDAADLDRYLQAIVSWVQVFGVDGVILDLSPIKDAGRAEAWLMQLRGEISKDRPDTLIAFKLAPGQSVVSARICDKGNFKRVEECVSGADSVPAYMSGEKVFLKVIPDGAGEETWERIASAVSRVPVNDVSIPLPGENAAGERFTPEGENPFTLAQVSEYLNRIAARVFEPFTKGYETARHYDKKFIPRLDQADGKALFKAKTAELSPGHTVTASALFLPLKIGEYVKANGNRDMLKTGRFLEIALEAAQRLPGTEGRLMEEKVASLKREAAGGAPETVVRCNEELFGFWEGMLERIFVEQYADAHAGALPFENAAERQAFARLLMKAGSLADTSPLSGEAPGIDGISASLGMLDLLSRLGLKGQGEGLLRALAPRIRAELLPVLSGAGVLPHRHVQALLKFATITYEYPVDRDRAALSAVVSDGLVSLAAKAGSDGLIETSEGNPAETQALYLGALRGYPARGAERAEFRERGDGAARGLVARYPSSRLREGLRSAKTDGFDPSSAERYLAQVNALIGVMQEEGKTASEIRSAVQALLPPLAGMMKSEAFSRPGSIAEFLAIMDILGDQEKQLTPGQLKDAIGEGLDNTIRGTGRIRSAA